MVLTKIDGVWQPGMFTYQTNGGSSQMEKIHERSELDAVWDAI